jgi:hypothetical protein
MVPITGLDQVTAVFEAPVMVAVNAADWPLVSEIHVGLTEIPTRGIKVTVAESVEWPGSMASTVTVVTVVTLEGALYSPVDEMVPTLGLSDQL